MPEAISNREAARRAGLAESTIRHHVANGGLAAAVLPGGKLDAEKVEKLLPKIVQRSTVAPPALALAKNRRLRAQVVSLSHEVADMQARYIPAADAERIARPLLEGMAVRLRKLPKFAEGMTASVVSPRKALPAATVRTMLRDRIHEALTSISTTAFAERDGEAWWDQPIKRGVDLTTLSPNDLLARRIELQSAKLEIDTMLKAGTVIAVRDVVTKVGGQLATAKSLLVAIPSRVAEGVSVATPAAARAIVAKEVAGVLAELAVAPPS